MENFESLLPGKYYHIYNRGINGENLFNLEEHKKGIAIRITCHVYWCIGMQSKEIIRTTDFAM